MDFLRLFKARIFFAVTLLQQKFRGSYGGGLQLRYFYPDKELPVSFMRKTFTFIHWEVQPDLGVLVGVSMYGLSPWFLTQRIARPMLLNPLLRWEQIDFSGGTIYVKRVKQGTPSTQPIYGDEIRALRKLQRDYPISPYVFQSSRRGPLAKDTIGGIIERAGELAELPFPVHAHMLRHGTGYYLANRGID